MGGAEGASCFTETIHKSLSVPSQSLLCSKKRLRANKCKCIRADISGSLKASIVRPCLVLVSLYQSRVSTLGPFEYS